MKVFGKNACVRVGCLLLAALLLHSCSSFRGYRGLSSDGALDEHYPFQTIDVPKDLALATTQFKEYITSDRFQAENCAAILNDVYQSIFPLDADHFDKQKALKDAEFILRNLWTSRIELRHRLGEFASADKATKECVDSMRNVLRAARFVEDYVGEMYAKPAAPDKKHLRPAFDGGFPYVFLNPAFGDKLELKSGDLLLSRGDAYTSAAIARIGDTDAQFSHLAVFYIDERTKEKFVIEAHIEIGSIVNTFANYVADGKIRSVVLRNPNATLAHQAAKRIHDYIKAASDTGENVPYDFGMIQNDHSEIFCSEVASFAYDMASKDLDENMHIPMFPTGIHMKNRDFLKNIGVKVNETFAPGDMEVEPRFEIVAEWRDYARVRDANMKDAVLTKMYEWMEHENYTLRGDPLTYLMKNTFYYLRRWPLFSSLLKDKFPLNMSKAALGTIYKLNDVSETLYEHLEKTDKAYKKKTGYRMTPKQMQDVLEKFREEDLARYLAYEKWREEDMRRGGEDRLPSPDTPKFHWDFRGGD